MIGLVEQLVALLDHAQPHAVGVVEIKMGNAVLITAGEIVGLGRQPLLQQRRRGQIGNAPGRRRYLPVPARQRQRKTGVGEFALNGRRAVGIDLHIGEEAVHDRPQPGVEIALQRRLKKTGRAKRRH